MPASTLDRCRTEYIVDALAQLHALNEEIQRDRDAISGVLHAAIGSSSQVASRSLLKLRRTLFKKQPVSADLIDVAQSTLAREQLQMVSAHAATIARLDQTKRSLAAQHAASSIFARDVLRNAVTDERFRAGLVLASNTLFANLARYVRSSGLSLSRLEQIERGLLRYITRATRKATPFGTFCTVLGGRFSPVATMNGRVEASIVGDAGLQQTHLRLDKRLYGALWSKLAGVPGVRPFLRVLINPTLRQSGDYLTFLASVKTRELVQRIRITPTIMAVLEVLEVASDLTLGELAAAIVKDPRFSASQSEALQYLAALVDAGLLNLRAPVRGQVANWAPDFLSFCQTVDHDDAHSSAALVSELAALAVESEDSSPERRATLYDTMQKAVYEQGPALGVPPHVQRKVPLYVDATAIASVCIPRSQGMDRALRDLEMFVGLTIRLAHPIGSQATMRRFFDATFGECEQVGLLEFYETYYRGHVKKHFEIEQRVRQIGPSAVPNGYEMDNPLGVERIRLIRAAERAVTDRILNAWQSNQGATEISIKADDLDAAMTGVPNTLDPWSVALFCQLAEFNDRDRPRIVVRCGQYFAGYGKYFSRFLYLLDPEITRVIVAQNNALSDDMLAELAGDSDFNANLHPPLLPWSLLYPTDDIDSVRPDQLRCSDIDVERHPSDDDMLVLRHRPTRRRVIPVDLGFLSARLRPPLFQLLCCFAPPAAFRLQLPDTMDGRTCHQHWNDGVNGPIPRPRIVFGDGLVLARRRWLVRSSDSPVIQPGERPEDYFVRANEWRIGIGTPLEVYVRVWPRRANAQSVNDARPDHEVTEGDEEEGSSSATGVSMKETGATRNDAAPTPAGPGGAAGAVPSRDWFKPQYIDFANPLLVRLFGRIGGTLAEYTLEIEEMYPGDESLPRSGGDRYSAEYILQLSAPNAGSMDTREATLHSAVVAEP